MSVKNTIHITKSIKLEKAMESIELKFNINDLQRDIVVGDIVICKRRDCLNLRLKVLGFENHYHNGTLYQYVKVRVIDEDQPKAPKHIYGATYLEYLSLVEIYKPNCYMPEPINGGASTILPEGIFTLPKSGYYSINGSGPIKLPEGTIIDRNKLNNEHQCTCNIRDLMTYGCKCGGK